MHRHAVEYSTYRRGPRSACCAAQSASAKGHQETPSFAIGMEELASIPDASKAWRGLDGRRHHPGDGCSPTTGRRG
jgi:hypothetical protein